MILYNLYSKLIKNNKWFTSINELDYIFNSINYNENYHYYDNYFSIQYSDLLVDDSLISDTSTIEDINILCKTFLYSNIEKIKRLFEIHTSEYNPLDNVDRYELFDKITNSNTYGERVSTSLDDNATSITINKVSGEDSENLLIDNETTNQIKGSGINDKIENKITNSEVIDTSITSGTGENGKIFNHIHGNIGVTKSTELLSSHYDFWELFNFLDKLYHDFFNFITIPIYKEV